MSYKKIVLDSEHIAISVETIRSIEWLIEHNQEGLKALLLRAYQNRLLKEKPDDIESLDPQETVLRLLSLIDILHQEITQESAAQNIFQNSLIPTIKQLDTSSFEKETVAQSTHKALKKKTKAQASKESKKSILYRELLKRWKPSKKQPSH
jgi:hypothetical protein